MKTLIFIMLFAFTSLDQPRIVVENKVYNDSILKVDSLRLQINQTRNKESKTKQEIAFTRDTIRQLTNLVSI